MPKAVELDLRLSSAQRTAIGNALTTLETLLAAPKFQAALAAWAQMDATQRAALLAKAPLLARFMSVAQQMPRN